MKVSVKDQFWVCLFNLDPITRKDLGFLIDVEVIPKEGEKYRTQVPSMDEGQLDELVQAVQEEAADQKMQVHQIKILACEEKPTF